MPADAVRVDTTEDVRAAGWADAARAEVTKLVTDPTVLWICLVTLAVNTALFTVAGLDVVRLSTGSGLAALADLGAVMFAPVYLFLVVPAFAAGNEYVSGQYRVTLTAIPDRGRLVTAKAAAFVAVTLPAAVVVLVPGRVVFTLSTGDSPAECLADVLRWVAAYMMMSALAFGLATVMRSRIAPVAILALVPLLLATGVLPWPQLVRLLPDQLSLSLLGTPGFDVTALPAGAAAALLAGWAVLAMAAQAVAVVLRDS